jgi:hypothetical protein
VLKGRQTGGVDVCWSQVLPQSHEPTRLPGMLTHLQDATDNLFTIVQRFSQRHVTDLAEAEEIAGPGM